MKMVTTGTGDRVGSTNQRVEILLKNGKIINGFVAGYFKKDIDEKQSPVIAWHIVNEVDKMSLGMDAFGCPAGEIVRQKDIETIKYIN